MHRVHHQILVQGRWVWADGGGGPPGQTPAGGGGSRGLVVATGVAREEEGGSAPPSERRVKMFDLAQINVCTPEVRKGGASHWRCIAMCWQAMGLGGMECVGRTWTWTATWSAIMRIRGCDPLASNRGAYAGLVCGIASCPQPKPMVPATPATGGLPQPHAPQPPGRLRQGPRGHLPRT